MQLGGMQGAPEQGADVGPEKRAELEGMLGELGNKRAEFNATQFASKNQSENAREEALMQVFKVMKENGIDPNNIEEVKAFIDELQQTNPEMYEAFVKAFEMLLEGGGEEVPEGMEGALPQQGAVAPGGMPQGMPAMPGAAREIPAAPQGMPTEAPGAMGAQYPNLGNMQ